MDDFKHLQKQFAQVGEKVLRKHLRKAVNAASSPTVKAAKQKAPKDSGLLKKSIKKKIKTYTKTGTVVGVIGPDTATQGVVNGKKRKPAHYAHLVDAGYVASNGTVVPGTKFLTGAYEETKEQGANILLNTLSDGISKELA